ncbi:uncharacterized protein LOC103576153 [Microplitis demolitor]|uniref:uncharacterized protein LOC103576153 n=1 Tax=Microplitis demolitor TaxID=69319 RepID=UPI0004CCC1BA|nr:uncharacterized protein LOC103576153 [Microplitis demolitor]
MMFFDRHKLSKQKLKADFPLDLHLYSKVPPPSTWKDLLTITNDRIEVLKIVNSVTRDNWNLSFTEKRKLVTNRLTKVERFDYVTLINSKGHQSCSDEDLQNRIIDLTSFVTLSLALITDDQYYEDFQRLEEKLFNIRVSALDDEGLLNVINIHTPYPQVNGCEKQKLRPKLISFLQNQSIYDTTKYFKVPISIILGFINPHQVYFNKGTAFIPFFLMKKVLSALFRKHLLDQINSWDVNFMEKYTKYFEQYDIFVNVMESVRNNFKRVQQLAVYDSGITAADVEKMYDKSFPPCMRNIHEVLRKNHHLKHESRLQYTLFLKGIGLPVQESLKLFKKEFTKTIDGELFNKEYKYYVEHAYGLRGSKRDYDPKCCSVIQNTQTALGDCNGCTFRISHAADIEDLGRKLSQWKIPEPDKNSIVTESRLGNCGTACALYFETINGCQMTEAIDHPNQYFKYSRFVKAKGLTGDSCFGSLDNVDLDYDKSLLNFTIEEINNEIDISDDNTEDLNVISNDNKRKAVDLDSDDANVPEIENNRNKKVKINPADINNLSNGKDKELENRTDTCTVNNCGDSKPSTSSAVSSKSDKIYSDMEIDPDFGMNDDDFLFIRDLAVEFDEIIPIENIKTGSIIYTPRGCG